MSQQSPFYLTPDEYTRDINYLKHYVHNAAYFLSSMTGQSEEVCKEYVRTNIAKGGKFEFRDTPVKCLVRQENGDREEVETTISQYIREVVQNKEILAPTFTSYKATSVQESLISIDIADNVRKRSKAKKEMFAARAAGDKKLQAIKKTQQTQFKLANNAVSGAHVTPSQPLYNKTAHSSLTSLCRSTSGYGNANNEKLLSGNRHYYNVETVINNIVSIISHTDYDAFDAMMAKYNLVYPSVDQAFECVTYSTNLYWKTKADLIKVYKVLSKLNASQLAAFVYTGDLYQVLKLNDAHMHLFITKLSNKIVGTCDDPVGVLKKAEDSQLNLAHQICSAETAGIGKDYTSIMDKQAIHTLACTVQNIQNTVAEYADFIRCIMVTSNLPASVAYFPESIRRAAVTSDTDSTIFTVQDWIIWYVGSEWFSERGIAVQAAMTYISSNAIIHILATMSANIGIDKKYIYDVAMKSEFRFDVFVPTNIGKTYYAFIGCQEGNVFTEHDEEIKGVQLKSSNVPAILNKKAKHMMVTIMKTVIKEGSISLVEWLKYVADVEREIMDSIRKGEPTYLRAGSIKDAKSYTKSIEESPYQYHTFWNKVFGPSVGIMPPPPYATAKVSLTTGNPTLTKKWLESCADKAFADRMRAYLAMRGKNEISTINVPLPMLEKAGIPPMLLEVVDYKKVAFELTKSFQLVLETLGYFVKPGQLISDQY